MEKTIMKRLAGLFTLFCAVSMMSGCAAMWGQYTGSKTLTNEHTTRTIDPVTTNYETLGAVEATGE